MKNICFATMIALPTGCLYAADPLAAKTMVVYATNSADSIAVKDHYTAARLISNVCPITLPNVAATSLSEADYNAFVRNPIRNCLTSVGRTNILYIVLAYIRPFHVDANNGQYYALDSYLADAWDQYATQSFNIFPSAAHRYFADNQSQGNYNLPFQTFEAYRASPRSTLIYSVWRLDGATPSIANGLVDRATSAMNNLTGAVCIDRRNNLNFTSDFGFGGGEWDLHQAASFLGQAAFQVAEDSDDAEFGTSPAPLTCPSPAGPVAFYAGWYSYNNYNGPGVFNFAPGSIGLHLDSFSAGDPRSGPNWVNNGLQAGVTVSSGAVNEPYLQGLTRAGGLARNLLEGANVGDAFLRNTRWLKWMILNIGDPLYRPFPITGRAPFNPPAPTDSLLIAARELLGGAATTGTVTLATAAPVGGTIVTLSSQVSSAASVPSSVMIPAGARSATFPITTNAVTSTTAFSISATFGATVLKNTMAVLPLLSFMNFSRGSTSAGASVTGTVYLNGSAPAGGITVALTSSDTSAATVPASIFIPAGIGRGSFTIATSQVVTNKSTIITANHAGTATQETLTVLPAIFVVEFLTASVNPGQASQFSVGLVHPAPPGGALVTLINSNPVAVLFGSNVINIPAGAYFGYIGFTAGPGPATATVQASYAGDTKSATINVN